ncbi:MAG TPA: NAD(P)H-hydrate dehydratase [Anaerolineales bacterium]|nr:NAD(P)H-hydrate dehydratase [Anaerolineales bacterium]
MQKIVSVQQMRDLEVEADFAGISYTSMMTLAGQALAREIQRLLPAGGRVLLLIGTGNNGGDGLTAAKFLQNSEYEILLYGAQTLYEEKLPTAAKGLRLPSHAVTWASQDAQWQTLQNWAQTADLLVDALLGIGAKLPLRPHLAELIGVVRAHLPQRVPVLAVDCPSGLDCDSGLFDPATLPATTTLTFGAYKTGLFQSNSADVVGELKFASIGWQAQIPDRTGFPRSVPDLADVQACLPTRSRTAHKGTFGTTLAAVGSQAYGGAALLASSAAYRVGSGLVTLASLPYLQAHLLTHLPEATWLSLPESAGYLNGDGAERLQAYFPKADSLLLGCGWGQSAHTAQLLQNLLAPDAPSLPPTVLDADALRLLADAPACWQNLPSQCVLTPHAGEMSALCGRPIAEIQAHRWEIASQFAQEKQVVLVLKGAYTVIANVDGRGMTLPFASAALARAGTGDVLAGMIAGLLAQGLPAYAAAWCGAYLHARAGLLAAQQHGQTASVLARDLLTALPAVLATPGTDEFYAALPAH